MVDLPKKNPLQYPETITAIDVGDLVLGGVGNGPNKLAEPLADRTDFLKAAVEAVVANSQNLIIGSDVQAWDEILDNLSALDGAGVLRKSGNTLSLVPRWVDNSVVHGRLTLESNVPFNDSDLSGDRVYYTPSVGNSIALYSASEWRYFNFAELSYPLSGTVANRNVDIFAQASGNNVSLNAEIWTSDNARAAALVRYEGVLVAANDFGRRYLGTVRTTGAGVSTDSDARRFVWNAYNRREKSLRKQNFDVNADWTYAGTTWRPMNNRTDNRIEVLAGQAAEVADVRIFGVAGTNAQIAIGINSTTTPELRYGFGQAAGTQSTTIGSMIQAPVILGLNYFQGLEITQGSTASFEANRIAISGRWSC